MILTNDELSKEFARTNPLVKKANLNLEQVQDIVYSPWRHLREIMESGELNAMRIKYFGIFQVYPKRAQLLRDRLDSDLEEGTISEKEYNRIKLMLDNFLNKQV